MDKINNQDPVSEALQHAGKLTEVTPELIALDKNRVTSKSNIKEEVCLFTANGVPCCPRGDVSAMTGIAKGGKTSAAAMLMACCVNKHVLGFERISEETLKAMWFDTEQSCFTTKRILTDRIGKLIGTEEFPDEQFFVFNVRHHTPQERIDMIALAVETYQPDICIIDGIADLLGDINNGPESVKLMQQLLTIATTNKCNITAMIHLNRTGEKLDLRGWIGTVMVQKSFEVFNCDKVRKTNVFSIELTFSRRYAFDQPIYYMYDDDGVPYETDEPKEARTGTQSKKTYNKSDDKKSFNKEFIDEHAEDSDLPWDYRKLFDTALNGASFMGCEDLEKRVMNLSGIRVKQYYDKVLASAEKKRIVKKTLDNRGRVAIIRLP